MHSSVRTPMSAHAANDPAPSRLTPASAKVACSNCSLRELCMPVGLTEEELAKRRAAWKPHIKESQTPWQELQRKFVGQLASGACLDFAVNYQKIAQTKGVPRHSH